MNATQTPRDKDAVVTIIDDQAATIDRIAGGTLTRMRFVAAPKVRGAAQPPTAAPAGGARTRTRGETADESAQRLRVSARRQFVSNVASTVANTAAAEELIVIGGSPLLTSSLKQTLARRHVRDAIVAEGLHRTLPDAELVDRVTAAVDAHLTTTPDGAEHGGVATLAGV